MRILQPAAGEDSTEAVAVHFRTAIKREHTRSPHRRSSHSRAADRRPAQLAAIARKMHVGHVNAYAAYVLLALLVVLVVGAGIF